MSTLFDKVNAILNEKTNKIIPNNIKNQVQIFDITGAYEGSGGGSNGIYKVSNISEMESLSAEENDICLVYNKTLNVVSKTSEFSSILFPDELTLDEFTITTSPTITYLHPNGRNADNPFRIRVGRTGVGVAVSTKLYIRADIYPSSTYSEVQYDTEDYIHYTKTNVVDPLGIIKGNTINFPHILKLSNTTSIQNNFDIIDGSKIFKIIDVDFSGLYSYSMNNWGYLDIRASIKPNSLFSGNAGYTSNGIVSGTLFGNDNKSHTLHTIEDKLTTINSYAADITDASYLFYNIRSLTNIESTYSYKAINFANVTNLSYFAYSCVNVTSLPNINTINVTDMSCAFGSLSNVTTVPNFNTSNVTNLCRAFAFLGKVTSMPNFNLCNVVDMSDTFEYCSNIKTFPNFNTSSVVNLRGCFCGCYNLTSAPNIDTSNAEDIGSLFTSVHNVTSVPNYNTSKVKVMAGVFSGSGLTTIPNWNTSNVEDFQGAFYNTKITAVPNWDFSNAINIVSIFSNVYSMTSANGFNAYKAINTNKVFNCCVNLVSVTNCDFSNGTSFKDMFSNCAKLTTLSNVKFSNCISEADGMFAACSNLTDLSSLELNLTGCELCGGIFSGCSNLRAIPNLDLTSTKTVAFLFSRCYNLNIPEYNLPNVTNMEGYVYNCNNLSNESLDNILKTCISAVNINSENKVLSNYVLKNTSYTAERIQALPSYQNFINAGWSIN